MRDYFEDDVRKVAVLADYVQPPRHVLERAARRMADANNKMIDTIIDVPRQWERDFDTVRDPLERRLLFRAFVDDALLTERRRKSIVSILLWSFVLAWAVAGIVVALVARPALPDFQAIYTLFTYGIATSIFLPLPFETLLRASERELGIPITVLVASVSKVVGAWIVLLMGDRAGGGIDAALERFPKGQQAWNAIVGLAQRYGYAAVFVLFVIPFMSDTLPLFLLAVMHLRKSVFLMVTFVAFVIRCLLFFLGAHLLF